MGGGGGGGGGVGKRGGRNDSEMQDSTSMIT